MHKHIDTLNEFGLTRTSDPRLKNLTLQYVPFDELYVDQYQTDTFSIDHLNDIMSEFDPALLRASSVALINNQYYLWDGQHSATAFWLRGMDMIPCMVYKCDDMSFKQSASVEKFDTVQLVSLVKQLIQENNIESMEDMTKFLSGFGN